MLRNMNSLMDRAAVLVIAVLAALPLAAVAVSPLMA